MDYTPEFEEFWKKYPYRWNPHNSTKVKRKKRPAFEKWQKLPPEIHAECLFKVKHIKSHEGSASAVRDCVTWLNQYGWEDIELEVPESIISKEMADKALPNTIKMHNVNVNDRRNELTKQLKEK